MSKDQKTKTKRTALHDRHVEAGARMAEFAGYEMPIQYAGIVKEHEAVRTSAGLFDVSHMGVLRMKGTRATEALEQLVTNHVGRLSPGEALYTPMCRNSGGVVDDLIIYRLWPDEFMLVVNASNVDKDREWIENHLTRGIDLLDESEETSLMALQGPEADQVAKDLGLAVRGMVPFGVRDVDLGGARCIAARTGYTGEDGFEFFVPAEASEKAWDQLIGHDAVSPAGLGARDTLRLEARLLLYGSDMTDETTPLEAGLKWTCKLDQPVSFNGREALEEQLEEGLTRKLVGLEMIGRGVARHGYPVFDGEEPVGEVTSGSFSPTLGKNIALAYVAKGHYKRGRELAVEIRGRKVPAKVVKTPFYKRKAD